MSFDPHTTHKPEATKLSGTATLTLHNKQYELPVISGTVGPDVVDISKLYGQSGASPTTRASPPRRRANPTLPILTATRAFSSIAATPSSSLPSRAPSWKPATSCFTAICRASSDISTSRTASPTTR